MTAALSTRVSDRWRKSENVYVCIAFKEALGLLETPHDCGLLCSSVGHVLACVQKVSRVACGWSEDVWTTGVMFCPEK